MTNVPFLHNLLLGFVVLCTLILGALHVLHSQEVSELFLAATGASFGHAVGHQVVAERRSKREAAALGLTDKEA